MNDIKENSAIHLFTQTTESADSVITVSWCVKKETLQQLKQKEIINPRLLLVVVRWDDDCYRRSETLRKLAPLDQMMEYIQFSGPGLHKIMSAIVWHDEGNFSALEQFFLEKDSPYHYSKAVLSYQKDELLRSPSGAVNIINTNNTIKINVAKEFFAKKPPKWLSWWVNLWYRYDPTDQCDFRKRCLITFPWKTIAVLFWLICKEILGVIISIFFLLSGIKGIDFSPIYRPFSNDLEDIWLDLKESIFFKRKYPYIAPFAPISLIAMGLFLYYLLWRETTLGFREITIVTIAVNSCASLFIGFICLLNWFADLTTKIKGLKQKIVKQKPRKPTEAELKRQELEKQYKNLSSVVCNGAGPISSFEDLPKEKRTFHLRFLNLKAKVCKPYARR